jgi:cytidyltransferase-like protein
MTTVAISGGFDPVHIGHIRLMEEGRALGDRLVVILNNDNWLKKKKGYAFMEEKEREAVLRAIRYVDDVIITKHPKDPKDMSVCETLEELRPDIFVNGGDRNEKDAANPASSLFKDINTCKELGIKMVFNVGGEKAQSSSELVKRAKNVSRP